MLCWIRQMRVKKWYRFSWVIECKEFNNIDLVSIIKSFVIRVSGAPEIYKLQILWITLGDSCEPEYPTSDLTFRFHNSTLSIYHRNEECLQLQKILAMTNILYHWTWLSQCFPATNVTLSPPLHWRTSFPSQIRSSKWSFVSVYKISVSHWLHLISVTIINKHVMESNANQRLQQSSHAWCTPHNLTILH